jgi:2-polyprenyl-6-hydroxyphenyl methylase/3-demethylubiquinone-9 3-methyltransferase
MASSANNTQSTTIDQEEVARFSAIADEWWDTKGKFAPLHRLNPVRIGYVRDQILQYLRNSHGANGTSATPLQNISLVDIGCGGGLLCEPMARLGANVTGVDASDTNITIARQHAKDAGLSIDYQATTAEALAATGTQFDAVLALEIIEHVADTTLFYDALTTLVKPGGLLILSTLNRTAKSYALGIVGAEYVLRWVPRGTHSWRKFVRPSEMARAIIARGFTIRDTTGIRFSPKDWAFSLDPQDLDVNYLMVAQKR